MRTPKCLPRYVDNPTASVPREQVEARLTDAKNYGLYPVRPGVQPHAVPRWAVYFEPE